MKTDASRITFGVTVGVIIGVVLMLFIGTEGIGIGIAIGVLAALLLGLETKLRSPGRAGDDRDGPR